MPKDNYNWWEDPKNKDEVERISWWNKPENQDVFNLPISVTKSVNGFVATCNDETKKFLGEECNGCGQGKTKEEAIRKMFHAIKAGHNFSEECRLSYQRFVPFRKGDWKHTGGTWFTIYGIHVYFRYGNGMKYGWYIPFTKSNISISSDWKVYKKWKSEQSKK